MADSAVHADWFHTQNVTITLDKKFVCFFTFYFGLFSCCKFLLSFLFSSLFERNLF